MENLIDNTYIAAYAPELDLSQYSATTISGMISQASRRVISYCEVDGFLEQAVTNERDRVRINSQGDLIISFRRRPVTQGNVSAIRFRTVDVNQSLTLQSGGDDIYFIPRPGTYMVYPSNYLISFGRGLLPLRSANIFYEIDYLGGYTGLTLPEDIKEATLLFVRDILSKKYNIMGATEFKQGSMSVKYDSAAGRVSPFVTQAQQLLDAGGYKRITP